MATPGSRRGRGRGIVGEGIINNGPKIGGEKKPPSPPVGPAPDVLNDEKRKRQQNPISIPMPSTPGNQPRRNLESTGPQEGINVSPQTPPIQQEPIADETPTPPPEQEATPEPGPDTANYTEQPASDPSDINSRLTNHELAINKLAQTMLQISSTVEGLGQQVASVGKVVEGVVPLIQQLLTGATPNAEGEVPGNGHGMGATGIDPSIIGSLLGNLGSTPNNEGGKAPIGNVISDVFAKAVQLISLINQLKANTPQRDPTQDLLASVQHAFGIIKNVNGMYTDLRKSIAEEMNLVEKASDVQRKIRKNEKSESE